MVMPLVKVVLHEGNINTILDPPGTGKTNFSVFLMEQAVRYNINSATNIHFFKFKDIDRAIELGRLPQLPAGQEYIPVPKQIHTCTSLSETLLHILNGGKNAVFIDEAGIFAASTSPMDRMVKQIKELAFIIRHLNSSYNLIAQAKKSIAPDLRDTLLTYEFNLKKVSPKYRSVHIYRKSSVEDEETGRASFQLIQKIGRIPLTRLPWDGYFIPKFDFDIDTHACWNALGDYDSIEVLDVARDIILGLKDEFSKQESKEEKVSAYELRRQALEYADELLKDGYTQKKDLARQVADKFRMSISWANSVLSGYEIH
jgi:hypothetical protein